MASTPSNTGASNIFFPPSVWQQLFVPTKKEPRLMRCRPGMTKQVESRAGIKTWPPTRPFFSNKIRCPCPPYPRLPPPLNRSDGCKPRTTGTELNVKVCVLHTCLLKLVNNVRWKIFHCWNVIRNVKGEQIRNTKRFRNKSSRLMPEWTW